MSNEKCAVCKKPLTQKRRTKTYCSNACRGRAYYRRKTGQKVIDDDKSESAAKDDIERLKQISLETYENLREIYRLSPRDIFTLALEAVWSALASKGITFNYDEEKWEYA